ncbi:MAG: alanine racemase [Bacillota bacterium]|nr:alanine racemase [Bacillota bacterium]
MDNSRPTWAEIDLTAIHRNVHRVKQLLHPQCNVMAVVKADAYGHGMVPVARTCLEAGATFLAVATLDEAVVLREAGMQAPVLVMGITPDGNAADAIAYDVDVAVFTIKTAEAFSKEACRQNKTARIHLKVDTGMGRIGLPCEQGSTEIVKQIYQLPGIVIRGIFSHLATADQTDKSFSNYQHQLFDQFCLQLEKQGIYIPIKHLANSAAIMDFPASHYNMVRSGIITYGLYPSAEVNRETLMLEPAMRLKTKILFLKTVKQGSSISYGRTFVSERETKVATVPIGYADGYNRLFSNKAWAVVHGQKIQLIGRVCMDQCMFDVTTVKDINEGDEVILFGKDTDGVTADDLARLIGTINYEIVCFPSSRVPRIYIA